MTDSTSQDWPVVSVIIPVRNEERYIASTLRYILDQDYPADKLEIIVVDGRSDDSTREKVEEVISEDARVSLLDNPRRLSSAARNIGARGAGGEIVTFIDGHVYISNNQLIKNTVLLMREKDVSVLSRPQFLDTPENDFFQRAVAAARKSKLGHGLDSTIYMKEEGFVDPASSGASYKKEVFTDVGYFDEDFDAAEDVDFNYRVGKAGYKSFTSIKLAIYYYPRKNLVDLFRQMRRYGVGRFRLFRKHKIAVTSGAMILGAYFSGLGLLALASLFYAPAAPALAIYLGLYLLLIFAGSLALAITGDFRQLPILPPIYIAIHSGLAYGQIREAIASVFRKKKDVESDDIEYFSP
jgi:glycosyltransferase involved in cell wall biosynthesis